MGDPRKEILLSFVKYIVDSDCQGMLIDSEISEELIDEWLEKNPIKKTPKPAFRPKGRAAPPMRRRESESNWERFLEDCDDALSEIRELPDRCNARDGWHDHVSSMREWAEQNNHVTDPMIESLDRILAGVSKWSH
tara:strand:- start:130 stop:537 length:408 start_codon:yes stop_codon:yes gene_type:complete